MTVFTNVSDDVLEPGDPIRSVDILAIKENTNYNHENTVLEILQEDIFTTSGTFTKATGFDDDDTVMIFLVGGGGSGGAIRMDGNGRVAGCGGFAGSVLVLTGRYADVPTSSHTLTIGAAGAAVSRTSAGATDGNSGGRSSLILGNRIMLADGGPGGPGEDGLRFIESTFNRNFSFRFYSFVIYTAYPSGGVSLARSRLTGTTNFIDGPLFSSNANFALRPQGPAGINPNSATIPANELFRAYGGQFISSGGGAALADGTNRAVYNATTSAFFNHGGAGSGTANGQNATGFGGGGGGCVRFNANTTSGAGGSGALVARYYRGRVSPFQVFGG